MNVRPLWFSLLALCLTAPAFAEPGAPAPIQVPIQAPVAAPMPAPMPNMQIQVPPPASATPPAQLQDQEQSTIDEQQQLQNQAGDELLKGQQMPPIEQCARLLRQQWKVGGIVHFLTAKVVNGAQVYVGGRATLPSAGGGHEIHYYKCYYNGDRSAVVSATVGKKVLH